VIIGFKEPNALAGLDDTVAFSSHQRPSNKPRATSPGAGFSVIYEYTLTPAIVGRWDANVSAIHRSTEPNRKFLSRFRRCAVRDCHCARAAQGKIASRCRALRRKQVRVPVWLREHNETRPHQGRWCFGKTPMQTFVDRVPLAKEKMLAA
jgi:hypothetical protein